MAKSRLCALMCALALTSACDNELFHPEDANSSDKAASVLLSVNSTRSWDQVASNLIPNFNMPDGNAALDQVVPITQRLQQQTLSALGVTGTAGLPQVSSATTNIATPSAPTGVPLGTTLPVIPTSADPTAEALLKFKAALALFQEVRLMNQQIQNFAEDNCFVPYMVQIKLAIVPYKKNLPYDVHANISFFNEFQITSDDEAALRTQGYVGDLNKTPLSEVFKKQVDKDHSEAGTASTSSDTSPTVLKISDPSIACSNFTDQPVIAPLLVTDDLERAVNSRSAETANQLALALSALIHGAGVGASVNSAYEKISSIIGQDTNSLLTVSRLSDNTLYAKIGANLQSTAKFAMIGQTYDISTVVLVPYGYVASKRRANKQIDLTAVLDTEFRDTVTGKTLAPRSTRTYVAQATDVVNHVFQAAVMKEVRDSWSHLKTEDKEYTAQLLLSYIQRNQYDRFYAQLTREKGVADLGFGIPQEANIAYFQAFWAELSRLSADSDLKTVKVRLNVPSNVRIAQQLAILSDDEKQATQVNLSSVQGDVTAQSLGAFIDLDYLTPKPTAEHRRIPANAVALASSGSTLSLTFPSLAKDKFTDLGHARLLVQSTKCDSRHRLCPDLEDDAGQIQTALVFPIAPVSADNTHKEIDVSTQSSGIAIDTSNNGKLIADVKLDTTQGETAKVSISGAVATVTALDGAAVTPDPKTKKITLKAAGAFAATFGGLVNGQPIDLSVEFDDSKGNKIDTKVLHFACVK